MHIYTLIPILNTALCYARIDYLHVYYVIYFVYLCSLGMQPVHRSRTFLASKWGY